MRKYGIINNFTGWLVFLIALTVYSLTLEPTASFWDCGEFIACSYKLMVPHAPGAPLFLLVGRLFSLFAADPAQVAWWVNFLSGLSSAFTSLFLFWTITILTRRALGCSAKHLGPAGLWLVMGSGMVGALAYTFTDTAWLSATEAEVYAMSSCFTAIVFWAMLRWEAKAGEAVADRWLILISYLLGLSIGVHLLNLVAIPALAFIFYFRRYKPTWGGSMLTFFTSTGILLFILWGIIPGLPSLAGNVEVFFVNSLGLPFGAGIVAFAVLLVGAFVYGLLYSVRHQHRLLNTAILCLAFVLIGYGSYLIIPIRSNYDPTLDINNPEDVMSFVSYLKREQYGDRPLLYGPHLFAQPVGQENGGTRYTKGKGRYVASTTVVPLYDSKDHVLLPRIYSDKPADMQEYKMWVDLREGQKPTYSQNLAFLLRYQLGHMYWRYFLWNFVGRESDVQHAGVLWFGRGSKDLPNSILQNKARNCFYLLPLLAGILGLIYQLRRARLDALVVSLLFFFTGMAIALYLNQPPAEPRERDYTFAASFYTFCIWVGMGVPALADLLQKLLRRKAVAVAFVMCLAVPAIMVVEGWDDHDRSQRYFSTAYAKNLLNSCAPNAILITHADNDTYPLWYAQEVEGYRTDVRVAVMTFLNTDWYINQMMRPAYKAAAWPLSLEPDSYRQGTNDYLPFVERPQVAAGIDLRQFMRLVKENHPALQVQTGSGSTLLSFPTKDFFLSINKAQVDELGFVAPGMESNITGSMHLRLNVPYLEKRHLVLLDLLSSNDWQRPVYFSSAIPVADYIGLYNYAQLEGLAYRIVPARSAGGQQQAFLNKEMLYDNLLNRFSYRSLDSNRVFLDQNYLRFTASVREKFALLAEAYLEEGNNEKAKEVVTFCMEKIPLDTVPADFYTPRFIPVLATAGDYQEAAALLDRVARDTLHELKYYSAKGGLFEREVHLSLYKLQHLILAAEASGFQKQAAALQEPFRLYLQSVQY